ncbi:cytoskeleton-associated protein 4 [Hyperolius riggenbachi]|uniref:cytoskeleton-associated protein 4 n=1 Tax=Hyperolius riggenbachi TaxID=752182 RepID=UPI0035A3818B
MTSARHRNKTNAPESHAQPAANDVAKKSHSKGSSKGAPPAPGGSGGTVVKLLSLLFYGVMVAGLLCTGGFLYVLHQEMTLIGSRLQHLSQQKGELAQTVHTLSKQVDILEKTVGRVEFISKDIQEKQQSHDMSIKNSEKELDVVGVILKKLQKDLSNVIEDVKDQGERDLVLFEKTMKEKFTELNNSINDDIVELTEVQKLSQEEISNVKAKMSSLGDVNSVTAELKTLKELFSELKTSHNAKEKSVEWLMNNAINAESVTANSNEIVALRSQHDLLKRDVEEHLATVKELKDKVEAKEQSAGQESLESVQKDFEQLSTSVKEIENNYVSANNDLLKEIESNRDSVELRLAPLEGSFEALNSQTSSFESLKASFEEYSRRLNAVEETFAGLKHLTSGSSKSPEETETVARLKEAQETLSQKVEALTSTMGNLPNTTPDLEKLQVEVSSVLESHKQQIEDLKYEYDQWKSNLGSSGSSDQESNVGGLKASIGKLESDLTRMREAVDSLVAYSVKIEIHDKELETVKESLEDLKENTDKLLVKFEHIQESV